MKMAEERSPSTNQVVSTMAKNFKPISTKREQVMPNLTTIKDMSSLVEDQYLIFIDTTSKDTTTMIKSRSTIQPLCLCGNTILSMALG